MKKYLGIITIIFLQACTSVEATFLEGAWQSSKELTVANFTDNSKLSEKRKDFLLNNLGELTIVFKANKTTIYFETSEEPEWGTFKVISQNDKEFTLSVTNRLLKDKEFTYYWAGKCFYLKQSDYGYDEYFCKIPSAI